MSISSWHLIRLSPALLQLAFIALSIASIALQISNALQPDFPTIKSEPFTIDLYHKFDPSQQYQPRGSILVRPKKELRAAQATIVNQVDLSDKDIEILTRDAKGIGLYFLKATLSDKKGQVSSPKQTQTLIKSCSLVNSNLADIITVNLNPLNEFLSINIITTDPECTNTEPTQLSNKFNTTVLIESGSVGPNPDTATYIRRLEEERQNKQAGKEDNRSFFGKYWMYIVPLVIFLMLFSGPEQGSR